MMQTIKKYTDDPEWVPKKERFNLRLTTEQQSKLWWIAKGKEKNMSEVLREMIDNA